MMQKYNLASWTSPETLQPKQTIKRDHQVVQTPLQKITKYKPDKKTINTIIDLSITGILIGSMLFVPKLLEKQNNKSKSISLLLGNSSKL